MSEVPDDPGAARAPSLRLRMACFLYEGVLLFGVIVGLVVLPAIAVSALIGGAPLSPPVLGGWFFVVLGAYFVHFWSHTGQTLAMLTWRIRLVTADGRPLSRTRAAARYLASWLWVLPAPLIVHLSGLKGWQPFLTALVAGIVAFAALSRLHPQRQYLHDAVCGTRLVPWQKKPRP